MSEAGDRPLPVRDIERLFPRLTGRFPRRYFLILRLVTRLGEAAVALRLGGTHRGALFLAAVACAAYDLWLARRLARVRPMSRLVLDAADVTLWSLAFPGLGDLIGIAVSPLAFEVGLRFGPLGLVVPLVTCSAAVLTVGTPLTYLWPVTSAAGGAGAAAYLRSRWRRQLLRSADELDAAVSQAELSGQNSVAMGADSVIDLLLRTDPLVAAYEERPAPAPYGRWKAQLAEDSGRRSAYLGVALRHWQRTHNERSPDLSADVELRPAPGAGTLLLSTGQARELGTLLDGLGLSGVVGVSVPAVRPVGEAQVIVVGGTRLDLPADPLPRPRPLHLAPIVFGLGVVLTLTHSLPFWEADPLWVTVPIATAVAVVAWRIHHADAEPDRIAGRMIAAALTLGAVDAIAASALATHPPGGRLPAMIFPQWVAPLAVAYGTELTVRQRLAAVTTGMAAIVIGVAVMPYDFSIGAVLADSPWWFISTVIALGLRDPAERDGAELRGKLALRHERAVREGYRNGRRLIIRLTTGAVEDLRRRYAALGPAVPPKVVAEIERRLRDATASLTAIDD